MSARHLLHQLVDELPAEEVPVAERLLRRLREGAVHGIDPKEPLAIPLDVTNTRTRLRGTKAQQLMGTARKFAPERDAVAELVAERAAEG
jgi:hypothetical protein